jgi:hypothetical protein
MVAAVVMLPVACDDLTIVTAHAWPEGFHLDGYWEGTVDRGRFEMTLAHDTLNQQVTGAGAWVPRAGSRAFRVEGVVSETQGVVSLLLELSPISTGLVPGTAPVLVHYRARPRGHNELRGRLNGGGFDDVVLVLRRTRPPR